MPADVFSSPAKSPPPPIPELIAAGLLRPGTAVRPLSPGNQDRRVTSRRHHWVVELADGQLAKLTVGAGLSAVASRIGAMARDCPGLVADPLFHREFNGTEILAESYFDGVSLEDAHREQRLPSSRLHAAFAFACAALRGSESVSDSAARENEWQRWADGVLGLDIWSEAERRSLRDSILPQLFARLSTHPCVTRWSNGDFLSSNLLVSDRGEPRLIDFEFAGRTHFFPEDAVRFQALSPAAAREPALFASELPTVGVAWHLFFWLRQLQLEAQNNNPEYLERVRATRFGTIRRLAEWTLSADCSAWSVPATALRHQTEEARWYPVNEPTIRLGGWCHVPGASIRRLCVYTDDRCVAAASPLPREDVRIHFADEPDALQAGFNLITEPVRADAELLLAAETTGGALLPFERINVAELPPGAPAWDDYSAWAAANDPDPPRPEPAAVPSGPLISVLLPVFNPPVAFLHSCLGSVLAQHYANWELCLVDDGSTSAEVAACLAEYSHMDPRLHVQRRPANGGISCATNDALQMARGEFVLFLDHDDLLRPHALLEFARHLKSRPDADVIYSDEDKITADGRRIAPLLKPDHSPEFALRVMYIGHALAVRTSVARLAGGFDPRFDGVQDFEFFLRVSALARAVDHIPSILYHWRQSAGSSALHGNAKGNMDAKQGEAVREHLLRIGRKDQVSARGGHRVLISAAPARTGEIVRPLANESALQALQRAAGQTNSDVLVLLAGEPVESSASWLRELSVLARRPDSGFVAPVLLSSDRRVLESGWTVWAEGAAPIMRGYDPSGDGYNGTLSSTREVAAVSPFCAAVRVDLLRFSAPEADSNWWDYCLQLSRHGVHHRVCATARLQVARSAGDHSDLVRRRFAVIADRYYPRYFEPSPAVYRLRNDTARHRLRWFLDSDIQEHGTYGCMIIRGWCFASARERVRGIRLVTTSLQFPGVIGLPRSDVRAALPEAPDDNTGFEIRGTLPPGEQILRIEAQTEDDHWHLLLEKKVRVNRRWLPLWLGGGDWTDLIFFQMPAHMAHLPRPVRPENFPNETVAREAPRFAIATPSFQQARFLPETMRSVLDQKGVAVDYVVHDGGSTDGSVEAIRAIAADSSTQPPSPEPHPQLAAWTSERDDGQADAIVRAFARTSGGPDDLMAWINSDDTYLPGALAFVADYFARHPEVDVLYGNRIVIDESSREIARWFLPEHDPAVLLLNDFVPQETLFWRRRIWDRVGGLDRSFKFAMDWDLLLRFQEAGARIVRVPYFLACFRVHPAQKTSSAMHTIGRKEIDHLRTRANKTEIPATALERNPLLLRYLRRSAFLEFIWRLHH
ncbi:MAG TPA: glycosyltransferase [Candidatus Didemnitutus sp.]|nr:glycosyltransferase [Candidatus Didemnitutus sp.]